MLQSETLLPEETDLAQWAEDEHGLENGEEEVLEADPESLGMSPDLRGPSGPNAADLSHPASECRGSMGLSAKAPAGPPGCQRADGGGRSQEHLAVTCGPQAGCLQASPQPGWPR